MTPNRIRAKLAWSMVARPPVLNGGAEILAVGARVGGVAAVFRRVLLELRNAGCDVHELTLPATGPPAWSGLIAAARALGRLRTAPIVHVEFGSNDTAVFWFALLAVLIRRDCVIVAHDYPKLINHPAAALVPSRSRVGRVIAYRLLSPMFDRRLADWLVRRAGVVVVFGSEALEGWRAWGARQVVEITHGSDSIPDAGELSPSMGEMVLCAGFMGPGKGIDVLLRAWELVRGLTELPLALAGPSYEPWFSETLSLHANGADLPRVLGEIESEAEFQRLISRAAIVVLPYRYSSPASGILIRALSAGRPVVVTPMPAMKRIVDGLNGLLVPVDDHRALAVALSRLCSSPEDRDRLGAAARRTAREQFTWEQHIDGLRSAYDLVNVGRQGGRERTRGG
jgi:glycosyltransferase involved in cell wall biosynthesis